MRDLRDYLISTIESKQLKIMSIEETIPQVTDEEQVELEKIINSLENQIVAYTDVLNRLPNHTQSLYESQCKYCQYFEIIGGIACCDGDRMDEDLFCIGMSCSNFELKWRY